jgi:rRNA maturation endonuclease Nob1
LRDTLVSLLVIVGILVVSALITDWFARKMYNRCAACGTLNARRRTHCRSCGKQLKDA